MWTDNTNGYQNYHYNNVNDDIGGSDVKRMKIQANDASSDSGEDTDNHDIASPSNVGMPMAQSTPSTVLYHMNPQQPVAYYNMNSYCSQQNHLQMQYMYPNHYSSFDNTNTSNEDSGNGTLIVPKPDNKILFCEVPGRLSLLGCNKKVVVTLAEIRRRIGAPECLNQSILSAILRKAKNKDGGTKLNTQLREHNITLAQGRRKSAPNTSFTALCETEACALAKDFHSVSEKHFPFDSMCYEMLMEIPDINVFNAKKAGFGAAFHHVSELLKLLARDTSPVMDLDLDRPVQMHPDSFKDFYNFSLITHGFGVPGHAASWHTMLKLFKNMLEVMNNPIGFCDRLQRPAPEWMNNMYPVQHSGYNGM